jgi:AcrR family transcriptional regulator
MSGLRDRKKKEVRDRIVTAAAELFAERGLDEATIEEIARTADVSVGTVYNYFGNKSALLLAGVQADTIRMITAGQAVIDDPGPDPVAAIQRLTDIYIDDLLGWDRRLLREVVGAAFQSFEGQDITMELVQMDEQLMAQIAVLLSHFRAQDKLGPDVEVQEATLLLYAVLMLPLFMFIAMDDLSPTDLRAQIGRQIELVFTGLGKGNRKKAN